MLVNRVIAGVKQSKLGHHVKNECDICSLIADGNTRHCTPHSLHSTTASVIDVTSQANLLVRIEDFGYLKIVIGRESSRESRVESQNSESRARDNVDNIKIIG